MNIMTYNTPDNWKLVKFSQLFEEQKEKVSDEDYTPLSVTKKGIVPQMTHVAKSHDSHNRKRVALGDFVINSRSDRKGSGGISKYNGSVSLINLVLEPREGHSRYLHHLLRSTAFQEEFFRFGHGIVADLWTTRFSEMKSIFLSIPPYETQKEIADFLDRETARIDQLIEKKKDFKNILHIRLLSIIHENICGFGASGKLISTLNPWISKLNSNFQILKLKQLIEFINGYAFDSTELSAEQGVPVLRIGDVKPEFDLDGARKYSGALNQQELKKIAVKKDDILIAMTGGTIGKTSLYKTNNLAYINQRVGIMRAKKINVDYLRAFLVSGIFIEQINLLAFGGAQPNISSTDICNVFIPIPPESVQEIVGNHLSKAIDRVSTMNSLIDKSLEGLISLKSSLITEAVTGQLDIQKWRRRGMTDRRLDKIEGDMKI